jgi:hypothetical protein
MNRREFLGSVAVASITSSSIFANTNGQIIPSKAVYNDIVFHRSKIDVVIPEHAWPRLVSQAGQEYFVPMAVPDDTIIMKSIKECEFACYQDDKDQTDFWTYVMCDNHKRLGIIVSPSPLKYEKDVYTVDIRHPLSRSNRWMGYRNE